AVTGEKYLVAYIIQESELDIQKVKSELMKQIPEYMIPTFFMQLDNLPLNTNGKVDRRALPEPDEKRIGIDTIYEEADNELEQHLVRIWQEVLQIEKISVHDDFFLLGGHSLKAMVLLAKIQKELKIKLGLKELFMHSSIR
ncbi:phosphopantetheine-binding protein, partial [Bacillus cereus]